MGERWAQREDGLSPHWHRGCCERHQWSLERRRGRADGCRGQHCPWKPPLRRLKGRQGAWRFSCLSSPWSGVSSYCLRPWRSVLCGSSIIRPLRCRCCLDPPCPITAPSQLCDARGPMERGAEHSKMGTGAELGQPKGGPRTPVG